jgi:hypothetical protein
LGKRKKLNAFGMSGPGRHVRLYHWLLESPAWKSLEPGPRALLIEVLQRLNGQNNGYVSLSVREAAERLHVNKDTAAKWFIELEEKGFLRHASEASSPTRSATPPSGSPQCGPTRTIRRPRTSSAGNRARKNKTRAH